MRQDIKIRKFQNIYDKVDDLYNNEFLSIKKSCDKLGITESYYYKICKKLDKKSAAYDEKSKNNKSKNSKKSNIIIQKGGKKNVDKVIDNDIENTDKHNILKGTFEERLGKIQNLGKE